MMKTGRTQGFKHNSWVFIGTDESLGSRYSTGISQKNIKFCKYNIKVKFILNREQEKTNKITSCRHNSVTQN